MRHTGRTETHRICDAVSVCACLPVTVWSYTFNFMAVHKLLFLECLAIADFTSIITESHMTVRSYAGKNTARLELSICRWSLAANILFCSKSLQSTSSICRIFFFTVHFRVKCRLTFFYLNFLWLKILLFVLPPYFFYKIFFCPLFLFLESQKYMNSPQLHSQNAAKFIFQIQLNLSNG